MRVARELPIATRARRALRLATSDPPARGEYEKHLARSRAAANFKRVQLLSHRRGCEVRVFDPSERPKLPARTEEEVRLSRVLVVDDDSASRLVLKSRLSEQGYEVAVAESGARGLMEARESKFDVFLVSAALSSGLPGWEVCRRIKAVPAASTVPVLLFSYTTPSDETLERGYEAGCVSFVFGSELPALDHVLRLALKQRRLVRDLADDARMLHEQIRRLQEEKQRPPERDTLSRNGSGDHATVLRELAAGRPDGLLLVDAEGSVRDADRGASELLGGRILGTHLGNLVPASGLEAFVRNAHSEVREGFRFDLVPRKGRAARSLSATVVPLVGHPGEHDPGVSAVLLYDAHKRRLAAEILQVCVAGGVRRELGALREIARDVYRPERLLGVSSTMTSLRDDVARAAQTLCPVLIVGEAGSGRTRIARTLHYAGASTGNFVQVHCNSVAPESLELELFGHVKGAYPGALSDRPGLLHEAQDGALYLEEIGEMPLSLQLQLMRFLDEGIVVRKGAPRGERLHARVIASSSRCLEALVHEGRFSRDLFERLGQTVLRVPSLGGRCDDIELLARHSIERFGSRTRVEGIADDALVVLRRHTWPGNVAQLEVCIEQACARADGGSLRADDLPAAIREADCDVPQRDIIPVKRAHGPLAQGTHAVADVSRDGAATASSHRDERATHSVVRERRPWDITDDDPVSLELYEKKVLLRALDMVGNDKLKAAKLLKVGKSTLYRKLKRFGIH
jgi:DNA-binding NtrC family response regulator